MTHTPEAHAGLDPDAQRSAAEAGSGSRRSSARRIVRAAPFVILGAASVWAAGRAPDGRQAPRMDWTVDGESVLRALTKWPHLLWMTVLLLLAVLAVGAARLWVAAVLTLLIGLGWELAETTVVGHHPRVVDLVPDIVAVAVACAVVAGVRALVAGRRRNRRRSQ